MSIVGFSRAEGKWLDPCIPLDFVHNTSTAMSDVPDVDNSPPPQATTRLASPPRLTPSPDATDPGLSWFTLLFSSELVYHC